MTMIKISNVLDIGEIVFLRTDDEQRERIVTGILIKGDGSVTYLLACSVTETEHYGFEITKDKTLML